MRRNGTRKPGNAGTSPDPQKASNHAAIICVTITAVAGIITSFIMRGGSTPPAEYVTVNIPAQTIPAAPYPTGPLSVNGSPAPVSVPAPPPARPSSPAAQPSPVSDHQNPPPRHPRHLTAKRPHTTGPATLQITILNTPGLLGTLLPPVQLQWSATVTENGSAVQQGCLINWTLYSDSTPSHLGTTACNGTHTLNHLLLCAGTFELTGDAELPSGATAQASADLTVQS